MKFYKIIELSSARVPVGVTEELLWVHETPDGRLIGLEEHTEQFMVTILELKSELKASLICGLETQKLDLFLVATFPTHVGVRLGLTWAAEYWQELAVQWVEHEASEEQFLPELQALVSQGSTQRIRHTARRLTRGVLSSKRQSRNPG